MANISASNTAQNIDKRYQNLKGNTTDTVSENNLFAYNWDDAVTVTPSWGDPGMYGGGSSGGGQPINLPGYKWDVKTTGYGDNSQIAQLQMQVAAKELELAELRKQMQDIIVQKIDEIQVSNLTEIVRYLNNLKERIEEHVDGTEESDTLSDVIFYLSELGLELEKLLPDEQV